MAGTSRTGIPGSGDPDPWIVSVPAAAFQHLPGDPGPSPGQAGPVSVPCPGRARRPGMTEAEWAACADPREMLTFLSGKASSRKFWLFSAACCRAAACLPEERCGAVTAFLEGLA